MELTNAEIFWQGVAIGSELTTKVSFTQLDKTAIRQKPQNNGMWGEDIIQVMYDVPNSRIQVWKFEGKAWIQVGKDIPIKFVDGDVFTVYAGKDGTVEIYRAEHLLSTRKPVVLETPTPTVTLTPAKKDASAPQLANIVPINFKLPAPISAPYQQSGTVTIDYVYDPLNRLTSATYSDGRNFAYTYDASGNVLELEQNLGPGTIITTYMYDTANQLNTAQQGSTTWQYTYDANGSLISDGVKNYTYNSANRLVQVSDQLSVTSLSYNGLGQRLSMDAAGVIATYVLDGDRPLTATSNGNTTFYLYGLGGIGEETSAWSYSLPDGTNTPRQLTNPQGDLTLSSRYTPWGDTLDSFGTGNFTFGYLGGVLDATTGLLYVGNGQYYDPATGRFLTRNVYPNNPNPYVPWNPLGAILGPLAVVSLFYTRRKKGSKAGTFLVLLLVTVSVGMTLSACGDNSNGQSNATPQYTYVPIGTNNYQVLENGTAIATVYVTPASPNIIVTVTAQATSCATVEALIPTITGTPIPSCPLCNSSLYARMLYDAVLNNQNDLPIGFSVALVLAMAEQESGGNPEPFRNSTTDGGAMQLRYDSGRRSMGVYPDTPEGYEQNVKDAIAVMNEGFNSVGNMEGTFWDYLETLYPEEKVNVVRAVLYYNAGYGWVMYYKDPSLNPYPNPRDPNVNLNEGYLIEVAEKLEGDVPEDFGLSDQSLVDPLKSAQHMVDCEIDPIYPAFNCSN